MVLHPKPVYSHAPILIHDSRPREHAEKRTVKVQCKSLHTLQTKEMDIDKAIRFIFYFLFQFLFSAENMTPSCYFLNNYICIDNKISVTARNHLESYIL